MRKWLIDLRKPPWRIFLSTVSAIGSIEPSSRVTRKKYGAYLAGKCPGVGRAAHQRLIGDQGLAHAITSPFRAAADTSQKRTETSLIERFLYPKFGPGQMWEEVASRITALGGALRLGHRIVGVQHKACRVTVRQRARRSTGEVRRVPCEKLISTIPVRDRHSRSRPGGFGIQRIAHGLPYRDFMTVGFLVRRMNTAASGRDRCRSEHHAAR